MGKRKCTQKQLDALARGRAKRLKKTTKTSYQPQITDFFKAENNTKPTPKIVEKQPTKKKHLITDYFNVDNTKKSDYVPKNKEESKKELKQKSIKDFFKVDTIKKSDYSSKKKDETENKTKKSMQSKITDFFKKLDKANKSKDNELTDQRIAEISKKIREDKPYEQNRTKNIIYNGETLEIPIVLLPEDTTFLEKNGNKIKNTAISAITLALMGYGAAKGYKYFMKYGAPILEAAIGLIFKTAEIGGKTVETTAKAAKATGKAASNAGSFIGKVGKGIFKVPGAVFDLTKEGTRKLLEALIL